MIGPIVMGSAVIRSHGDCLSRRRMNYLVLNNKNDLDIKYKECCNLCFCVHPWVMGGVSSGESWSKLYNFSISEAT